MKRTRWSISIMLVGAAVLTGCGVNDRAQYDNTTVENTGLYTDDKNANRKTGAFRYINDRGFNDQHMVVQVNELNHNRNVVYPTRGNYGYEDYNYHGHLNTTYNGFPTRSYNTGHENVVAQKITDRIEHVANVKDVAAIIDGHTIIVFLATEDKKIKRKVRRIAEGMADGREVKVITDKSMFTRENNVNTY